MPTVLDNKPLVALLQRWTTAAEQAGYSSSQASTFRKAAKSLSAHPTAISCKADALAVKYVGEAIASALADHLAFARLQSGPPARAVRTVARLRACGAPKEHRGALGAPACGSRVLADTTAALARLSDAGDGSSSDGPSCRRGRGGVCMGEAYPTASGLVSPLEPLDDELNVCKQS